MIVQLRYVLAAAGLAGALAFGTARPRRDGDKIHKRFYTDIATPVTLEPGADLMLLHPDGSEELLVKGGDGAVTDPMVSLDGEWVFYTLIHTLKDAGPWQPPRKGADIYKIHVRS